jgi:hypothetical protein
MTSDSAARPLSAHFLVTGDCNAKERKQGKDPEVSSDSLATIRFPRARRQTFESPDQKVETGTFLATAVAAIRQSTK